MSWKMTPRERAEEANARVIGARLLYLRALRMAPRESGLVHAAALRLTRAVNEYAAALDLVHAEGERFYQRNASR